MLFCSHSQIVCVPVANDFKKVDNLMAHGSMQASEPALSIKVEPGSERQDANGAQGIKREAEDTMGAQGIAKRIKSEPA